MKMDFENSNSLAYWVVLTMFASLLGCMPSEVVSPHVRDVHGKVYLDGQPVPFAVVVFVPMNLHCRSGQPLPISYGLTDEQGEFTLQRSDKLRGAEVGLHQVIISKTSSSTCNNSAPYRSSRDIARVKKYGAIVEQALNPLKRAHCKADERASMAICGCGLAQPKHELIPSIYNAIRSCSAESRRSMRRPNCDSI